MITTVITAPFGAVFLFGGIASALVILPVGGILAVYLTTDVKPGELGPGDYASAGGASALVGIYFLVAFYMIYWRNIESYFSSVPWVAAASMSTEIVGERLYQKRCPFTGLRPAFRCPSCQCRVHETAFQGSGKQRFISLPFGETVLRWDLASAAAESEESDTTKSRAALDEALDFRGNFLTQRVAASCIGCATWQKCFNLALRFSLQLAVTALFFAFIPWAFTSFLVLIEEAGSIVKIVTGSMSVGFATAALFVLVRALGRVNVFMSRHAISVPALKPIKQVPETGFWARMQRVLFATRWDPLL